MRPLLSPPDRKLSTLLYLNESLYPFLLAYVLTVDQRDSRHSDDAVSGALDRLSALHATGPFERTVGDELQGVLEDPLSVVQAILILMDQTAWHIGIGVGPVPNPLPASVRSARGPAFVAARSAVEDAKHRDSVVEIATGTPDPLADDATVACQLLVDLVQRRSDAGAEAVRLARDGLGQGQIAERLGVSRQAIGQRLAAARWSLEQRAVPTIAGLLARVDLSTTGPTGRVGP